jgi:acetyl esterase/lipase
LTEKHLKSIFAVRIMLKKFPTSFSTSLLVILVAVFSTSCNNRNHKFTLVEANYTDLAYADSSSQQKLDLYLPTTGSKPYPVLIVIHGGGFIFGDKTEGFGLPRIDSFLAAGYAVASINYRFSSEAVYPAQIFDAKAAVRFLRANATQYNLNSQKIGVLGASAGGQLAALLGTTCGVKELEGSELGNANQSSCVQAVVDWFGLINFLAMDAQFIGTNCSQNHDENDSPESKLVGAAIQTTILAVNRTNPTKYITADAAPFFIQHGTDDCTIPPAQSKGLADALRVSIGSNKVTYLTLEGAGHGGKPFEKAENLNLVIRFLDKYLK